MKSEMDRLKKINFSIKVRIFHFPVAISNICFLFFFVYSCALSHFVMVQRKLDNVVKEKEEVIKENQSLLKQMEDLKSSTSTLVLIQMHHFLSHLGRPFE